MKSLEQIITAMYGEPGIAWLQNLPQIVAEFAQYWQLRDLIPCANLSYNYVAAGWRDQEPVILKVAIDKKTLIKETAALDAFHGHGMVRLLAQDLDRGGILLQRAVPGVTLKTYFPERDDEAIKVACKMVTKLHTASLPKQHKFPTLRDWFSTIDQDWDIPLHILQRARSLRDKLLAEPCEPVLLHGDLHYDNILSNGDDWLVIDPKGVVGNPMFDKTGTLVREPSSKLMLQPDPKSIVQRRIDYIANYFNLSYDLIVEWTFMQAVMATCWCFEDKQDPATMFKFMDVLTAL